MSVIIMYLDILHSNKHFCLSVCLSVVWLTLLVIFFLPGSMRLSVCLWSGLPCWWFFSCRGPCVCLSVCGLAYLFGDLLLAGVHASVCLSVVWLTLLVIFFLPGSMRRSVCLSVVWLTLLVIFFLPGSMRLSLAVGAACKVLVMVVDVSMSTLALSLSFCGL